MIWGPPGRTPLKRNSKSIAWGPKWSISCSVSGKSPRSDPGSSREDSPETELKIDRLGPQVVDFLLRFKGEDPLRAELSINRLNPHVVDFLFRFKGVLPGGPP